MAQIRMLAEAQTPSTVTQLGIYELGRAELDTTETCSQQCSPALNPAVKCGAGDGGSNRSRSTESVAGVGLMAVEEVKRGRFTLLKVTFGVPLYSQKPSGGPSTCYFSAPNCYHAHNFFLRTVSKDSCGKIP